VWNTSIAKLAIYGFFRENKYLQAEQEDYPDIRVPGCWPDASWLAERTEAHKERRVPDAPRNPLLRCGILWW
jgi:hypothetical protein